MGSRKRNAGKTVLIVKPPMHMYLCEEPVKSCSKMVKGWCQLEEVDNDTEGEEDAEAEFLEAVNAAEEAADALREKSNGAN